MSWTLIESVSLSSSQASVTLGSGGSLPQTYKTLKVLVSGRSDKSSVQTYAVLSFNGSTANFTDRGLGGNGTSTYSWTTPGNFFGEIVGNSATANTFSNSELTIPNYTGSTNKAFSADAVAESNGSLAQQSLAAGLWSQTAAITSITFTPETGNWLSGSSFTLYGLK